MLVTPPTYLKPTTYDFDVVAFRMKRVRSKKLNPKLSIQMIIKAKTTIIGHYFAMFREETKCHTIFWGKYACNFEWTTDTSIEMSHRQHSTSNEQTILHRWNFDVAINVSNSKFVMEHKKIFNVHLKCMHNCYRCTIIVYIYKLKIFMINFCWLHLNHVLCHFIDKYFTFNSNT